MFFSFSQNILEILNYNTQQYLASKMGIARNLLSRLFINTLDWLLQTQYCCHLTPPSPPPMTVCWPYRHHGRTVHPLSSTLKSWSQFTLKFSHILATETSINSFIVQCLISNLEVWLESSWRVHSIDSPMILINLKNSKRDRKQYWSNRSKNGLNFSIFWIFGRILN